MSDLFALTSQDVYRLRTLLAAFEQGRLNVADPGPQPTAMKGQDTYLGHVPQTIPAQSTGSAYICAVDRTQSDVTQAVSDITNLDRDVTVLNRTDQDIKAGYYPMSREPTSGFFIVGAGAGTAGTANWGVIAGTPQQSVQTTSGTVICFAGTVNGVGAVWLENPNLSAGEQPEDIAYNWTIPAFPTGISEVNTNIPVYMYLTPPDAGTTLRGLVTKDYQQLAGTKNFVNGVNPWPGQPNANIICDAMMAVGTGAYNYATFYCGEGPAAVVSQMGNGESLELWVSQSYISLGTPGEIGVTNSGGTLPTPAWNLMVTAGSNSWLGSTGIGADGTTTINGVVILNGQLMSSGTNTISTGGGGGSTQPQIVNIDGGRWE